MARRWYTYDTRDSYLSEGVNNAWWVRHLAFGRESSDDSPYLIANEWICACIGAFLRLPIPPFALMKQGTTDGMFVSFKYGSSGVTPDDVDPAACVKHLPFLSAGIVLFDILVANADRHTSNLKVDAPQEPKEIEVFDHDHALFGIVRGHAVQRFQRLTDRVATSGGSETGENTNCLLLEIDTATHLWGWVERISTIPNWFLKDICDEVVGVTVTREEADSAFDFLWYRRNTLDQLIKNNRAKFPRISDWGLL